MKKLNRTHKTKDEKRRLLLTRKYAMSQKRIQKHGSDSVGAIAVDYNRRFIAAFVALVIAISCMAVGFGVRTKAEDNPYEEADQPIEFGVLVNGEELLDSSASSYTVFFPSALIENGNIQNGISYQKTDGEDNILVDSIQNKVSAEIQKNDNYSSNNEPVYLSAFISNENGPAIEVTNVAIDGDGRVTYIPSDSDVSYNVEDSSDWLVLDDAEKLFLSFYVDINEISATEASNDFIFAETEDVSEVQEDGSIPEINGQIPTMVRKLFAASSESTSSHLQPVDFNIIYNDVTKDDITISVPAGNIEENMSSSTVSAQEAEKLYSQATWERAVIWKYDSDSGTYTQYEIANIGKYNNKIYYSFKGNNEDTGILIDDNDKLYLIYSLSFNVTYEFSPEEGGNSESAVTEIAYGQSLPVSFTTNDLYTVSSTTYNVKTVDGSGFIYGSPMTVSNSTIPSSDVIGDIVIYASFAKASSYWINGDNVDHGHICATHSMSYSQSNGGDNLAKYGSVDTSTTMNGLQHGVTVTAGGTAYLVLFGQKASSSTDKYFLNAIWLTSGEHVELINVPTTYSDTASTSERIKETELTYAGTKATVELYSSAAKDSDLATSNAQRAERYQYIIKIEGVKSNITLETYFRPYSETRMYLKGLRGIANTAAAYPVDTYRHWVVPVQIGYGNNVFYYFDENGTHKDFSHMFRSMNIDMLANEIDSFQSDFLSLAHQLKPYSKSYIAYEHEQFDTFHIHNIFLAKVKPGYNTNSMQFTDFLANYSDTVGSTYLSNAKVFDLSTSTTVTNFRNSISDEQQTFYSRAGFSSWREVGPGWYCWWNSKLTSNNITKSTIDMDDTVYNIYTHESADNSYSNNRSAVLSYTPFLTGTSDQRYYKGIAFQDLDYYNNSLQINANAYKYEIQYLYNGVNEDSSVNVSNATINYDTSKFTEATTSNSIAANVTDGAPAFKETNRHAIEITTNNSSSADANEFDGVEGKTITLPKNYPSHESDSNYMYSFLGWKLVKYNSSTKTYSNADGKTDSATKLYQPGESFSLDAQNGNDYYYVGSYTVSGTGSNNGYYAQKCQYDVTSGEADKGYAWGDYTSSDDRALTFTFMPVWRTTSIGGYIPYTVRAYKDTVDDDVIKDGTSGEPITIEKNEKTYYLYYENSSSKAAPNSEIISLNQHYPTDGKTYDMNEDLTDEKIDSLTAGTDDTIVYYYDVSEFAVNITELTQPKSGDPDYTDKDKAFTILLTLTKEDGTVADAGTYGDVTFTTTDGSTTATLSLANGQSKAISIPSGYKLTVTEDATSQTCSAGTYVVTYSEDGGSTATETYSNKSVNDAKTITVINTLAAPTEIASGILDKATPLTMIMIVIATMLVAAAIVCVIYTKKRKTE